MCENMSDKHERNNKNNDITEQKQDHLVDPETGELTVVKEIEGSSNDKRNEITRSRSPSSSSDISMEELRLPKERTVESVKTKCNNTGKRCVLSKRSAQAFSPRVRDSQGRGGQVQGVAERREQGLQ